MSTAESFAANPDRVQKTPQVPYLSPYFAVDSSSHVVLQIRDSQTGKVLESYPSSREAQARNSTQQAAVEGTAHATPQPGASVNSIHTPAPQQGSAPSGAAPSGATGRQIAAFTAASQAGSGASTGSQVTVLA